MQKFKAGVLYFMTMIRFDIEARMFLDHIPIKIIFLNNLEAFFVKL